MNQKHSTFRNSKIHYSSKLTKTIAKKRNDKTNDLNTSNTSNELILGIATRTMTKFFAQLRETLKTLKLLKLCVSPLWRPFLFDCMLLLEPTLGQRNPVVSFSKARVERGGRQVDESKGSSMWIPPWKESTNQSGGHIWERGSFFNLKLR